MKLTLSILAVAAAALAGCATHDTTPQAPRPGDGIAEYRHIVHDSLKAIAKATSSLDRVSAQTNRCSPRLVSAFSAEVQQLQVKSLTIRSRAQAIQARGDAYFQNWEENLAAVRNPQVRELAKQHHPELQQSFGRIKQASRQAGEAFKPFLSGLRTLQNDLETDAGKVGTSATRELISTTREQGRRVEEALAAIRGELDAMTLMLTPAKPPTHH